MVSLFHRATINNLGVRVIMTHRVYGVVGAVCRLVRRKDATFDVLLVQL